MKPKIKISRYATGMYHVFIDGMHWGNVVKVRPRSWRSTWFDRRVPGSYDVSGVSNGHPTRTEAVAEVRIQTASDR